ncbi:conserved hypothetical protein [Hyphomicrobiales bacterium]|nr:conserved hypothetical protein [Hyphomicrobiales bacterium]CAH1674809.1 conserved hypothetical protein [Hyphomicrobiales bacterium]
MKSQLLNNADGQRIFAVVLEQGDEAMACIERFAAENNLSGAQVTAIGAFSNARLQYFDWDSKAYLDIPVDEQSEVASLIGDIALSPEGKPALHLHAVLGLRDGRAVAGHFASGSVRPTLEVLISEAPRHLQKAFDPQSGLALIKPQP